jgi:diadenosine tetraphosphate (Ap4A) HIT family hydrolase
MMDERPFPFEGARADASDADALESSTRPLESMHAAFDRLEPRTKADATLQLIGESRSLPPRFSACALCGLVGGQGDARLVVRESRHAFVVLNRFPTRPGQLLVVLRRHVEQYVDLDWDEQVEVQRLAWEGARVIERLWSPTRVYLASFGTPAKLVTSTPHHHQHVTPIFSRDERDRPARVFSWSAGLYRYKRGADVSTASELRQAWSTEPFTGGARRSTSPAASASGEHEVVAALGSVRAGTAASASSGPRR